MNLRFMINFVLQCRPLAQQLSRHGVHDFMPVGEYSNINRARF